MSGVGAFRHPGRMGIGDTVEGRDHQEDECGEQGLATGICSTIVVDTALTYP
jgi:hypothetical protein